MNYDPLEKSSFGCFYQGFYLKEPLISIYCSFCVLFTFLFLLYSSLSMAFGIDTMNVPSSLIILGIGWLLIEITLGFTRRTIFQGRMLAAIPEIALHYLRTGFMVDLCSFVILIFDLAALQIPAGLRLLYFLRIPRSMESLFRLETKWLKSTQIEQYWFLIKVVIKNFFFAHAVAIALLLMAGITAQNWLVVKGIEHSPWYEQYGWAYYWAINIILTVGFGDLTAANFSEALGLIFIETIGCLTLAYNINCIGELLGKIRAKAH